MPEKPPSLRWQILSDAEVTSGVNDAFGVHTAYARLLQQIATKCPTPFSIGLYSSWGTGKTSIIRLLQEIIGKDPKALSLIYLDVWKYSSDPLKRWVLLETERQLADQKLLDDYKFQNRSMQSHLEFEEELEDKDKLEIDFKNFALVLGILLAGVVLCGIAWAWVPASWRIRDALRFILALSAGGGVIAIIMTAALKKAGESMSGLLFRRTIKHITAKPAFSSEKFSQIFRDIVAKVTQGKDKRRLVFVFDNLDRCQADVAVEAIGVIKTFLEEPGCVYVIPCDEEAILTHIKASFLKTSDPEVSDSYANQFLAKLFQMTLRLPPAADFAVEDYVDREVKEAKMEDLTNDARDVLVLGYRGETPRQVKRVLNDLIAYRGIAEQIEADGLVESGALTTDLGHLTKMAVLSVKWPSFMRRLAEDPVLWTDAMQRIRSQADTGMEDITQDLQQFLWNTRLVSPDVDIRPWLYLRRGTLEKDAALNRRVEEILQNGAWKQLLDMLVDESLRDKNNVIVQIATTKVRRWRLNSRRVLLRNAVPVILKASLAVPSNADLRKDALDFLDYLVTDASPEEMEQVFDVKDVLAITREAPYWVRKKSLSKYARLFGTNYPATDGRSEIWKQIIQHGDLLDASDRAEVAIDLVNRYAMPATGEADVMSLVILATEDLPKREWCIKPSLPESIANGLTFDGSEPDKKRMNALVALRKILTPVAMKTLLTKVTHAIDPTRISQLDAPAQSGISTLFRIELELLRDHDLKPTVEGLFLQANRSPVPSRAWWLAGLLHLYPLLGEADLAQMDTLFKTTCVDADPGETLKLYAALNKTWRKSLLGLNRFRSLLRTQAGNYLSRFGSSALAMREQQILAFDPVDVLQYPEIFDESLSWDLAIFVRAIKQALETKAIDAQEASRKLGDFCAKHLASAGPAPNELYTEVLQFLESFPETASVALAEIVVRREMSTILAEDYSAYPRFRRFKSVLPPPRRLELAKELMQPLSARKGKWDQLLTLLVTDVSGDEDTSKNAALVADLADYAFSGAREKWAETTGCLASIVSLLEPARQQDYVDRSLEALIALEADGDEITKMEPFLRLVEAQAQHLQDAALASKATKFIQRMLGAGRPDPAKLRILQFASPLNRNVLGTLRQSIEQLAQSAETQVSTEAKVILQKLEPPATADN